MGARAPHLMGTEAGVLMKKWFVVLILGAAQFVMVLDTTVMNVAIPDVVADLDTTVSQVQLAITLYTLVMASLRITGGRIGGILGRKRARSRSGV